MVSINKRKMTETGKQNWDKMFRIMNNPDVSSGTKEAMIRETFLPPVRTVDNINTLESRIEDGCASFFRNRQDGKALLKMSKQTSIELTKLFESRYSIAKTGNWEEIEINVLRIQAWELDIIYDEELRLGEFKLAPLKSK